MVTSDKSNPEHEILQKNLEILKSVRLRNNKLLKVEILELPETGFDNEINKNFKNITLSYAGFYIANGVVLIPFFNLDQDAEAMDLIKKYFPGRKVIPIESTLLAQGKGSIHAITQQWQGITY
jgi:agmatine deiminase